MSDSDRAVSVIAVGDLAFNARYHRLLERFGPEHPFRDLKVPWSSADLRLGNLESPLTVEPRVTPIKMTLRGSLRASESLVYAGLNCVSLANNHMMDFGPAGLLETCARLDDAGIAHVGAGKDANEASQPAILHHHGLNIGVLAYCSVEQVSPLYAGSREPGVSRLELDRCLQDVRSIRDHVDWLIVQVHWGAEMSQLPSSSQRAVAHRLADAGVDLILGHHPHVLQPLEVIDRTPVAYSLGDFTFSSTFWHGVNARSDFLALFSVSPLSRQTGWIEVVLSSSGPKEPVFRPAHLSEDLIVRPDRSPGRLRMWHSLCGHLASPNYDELYAAEQKVAKTRDRWRLNREKLSRRILLKLLHWGLLPGSYVEPEGYQWRSKYCKQAS